MLRLREAPRPSKHELFRDTKKREDAKKRKHGEQLAPSPFSLSLSHNTEKHDLQRPLAASPVPTSPSPMQSQYPRTAPPCAKRRARPRPRPAARAAGRKKTASCPPCRCHRPCLRETSTCPVRDQAPPLYRGKPASAGAFAAARAAATTERRRRRATNLRQSRSHHPFHPHRCHRCHRPSPWMTWSVRNTRQPPPLSGLRGSRRRLPPPCGPPWESSL